MGISLGSNFDVQTALPLDSRTVVADLTARDAIASLRRYEGMIVYVEAEETNFQLVGGITNGNWAELSGGGGGGGETTGPFTVNNNDNDDLTDEVTDSSLYDQVDYVVRVIRGTTVFTRDEFSIFFRNGAWELVPGFDRGVASSGMTYTVDPTTGQINAAADNGAGNATLTIKKILWVI